ncbi:hypothetical protein K449DRAFT_394121 [Hypoxylon sp. EC38]|nr:hypothetical protein K449DRAFT_394121 [Hypoxylon sp. EC38]
MAPVTELVILPIKPDVSAATVSSILDDVLAGHEQPEPPLPRHAPVAEGQALLGVEQAQEHVRAARTDVDYKGEPSRALVTVIGWTSVEAHMKKTRENPEFEKIIPMIRGLEGLKGMEMVHVTNTTIEKS